MPDTTNKDRSQKGALQPGQKAPNFTLKSMDGQTVSLQDFRGRPVVLVFYPADWSPVCTDELGLYNELLPEFQKFNAQVLGISVDSHWSHKAFSKDRNLHFPLLADFEPKGAVARSYGVYDEQKGREERALFVIDPQGMIYWSYVSPTDENPGADGVLDALERMQKEQNQEQEAHGQAHQTHS